MISCYAPTLTSSEDSKDLFYEELDKLLSATPRNDKIVVLGDFNARVGSNVTVWHGIIGKHGVGKENANGLRLLNTCALHRLTITNTLFQLPTKQKTTWMHPRSKHWHLIDYIITRQSDIQDFKVTKALRGAECWTDHRPIRSVVQFVVRPSNRKQNKKQQINRNLLQDQGKRKELQDRLSQAIEQLPEPTDNTNLDQMNANWNEFTNTLHHTASEVLGISKKKHQDWFDENDAEIHTLLQRKNEAHAALLSNQNNHSLRANFNNLRAEAQRSLRRMQNDWWCQKAREIQQFADENDQQSFFAAVKATYGPRQSSIAPLKAADGHIIKDQQGVLDRWSEYLSQLLNQVNPIDAQFADRLPCLPLLDHPDAAPTFTEVHAACKSLRNNKAAGPDGIPAELFKFGGHAVTRRLHKWTKVFWEAGYLPQSLKDPIMVMIYKKKGLTIAQSLS
ncbi:uncharacterized protein LOC143021966 [Oratosquilla oratoria]|uniref:uncharacterized protein LOC143021966 n=1 Tax=Oratosquilla oratoria TaxID=337810 RepID=UPI003F775AF5